MRLHCVRYWVGSDLKTTNPATGEAEKGCLYYPQPPPGHVLYPSRKTYGKQKFIELEKLHHCTFVSGDFQGGGDITFVLNMLVTQREVLNFRCMVRDVNVAQKSIFPVANKRNELIVSKRPYRQCEECEGPLDTPIQYCSCCGAARCSNCMTSVSRIPRCVSARRCIERTQHLTRHSATATKTTPGRNCVSTRVLQIQASSPRCCKNRLG